jgi:glycosyltransferase involved in cell wall biosynthesis
MSPKKKILWSADAVAKTGFGRVTENLIYRLKDRYEIVVLANNWWGDSCEMQKDFKMYPSSNRFAQEPFGVNRIREVVETEKPDLVFVNNDVWIVNNLYKQIEDLHKAGNFKFVAYMPMDSYAWTGCITDFMNVWDEVICYTEFGAKDWQAWGCEKPVAVIPHGITEGQFYPIDKLEARKRLGLDPDDFIILNANRNQARKRIDITIDAFAQFAVGRPDTKLYLHMGLKDQGWDVMNLFGKQMRRHGLDPNGRIIMTTQGTQPPNVPVELLNVIYNAADIGVNTCKGEGHGLVNHEHAACRVAQVVPNHTSCKEIFEGAGVLIESEFIDIDMNFNREMPMPSARHLAEIFADLYEDRTLLEAYAESCYERATDDKYQWSTIATQFDEIFADNLGLQEADIVTISDVEIIETKKKKKKRTRKSKEELVKV